MIIAYATVDQDGIPTGGGSNRKLPKGAIPLTPPWTSLDLPRIRWTGEAWVEREPSDAEYIPTREEVLAEVAAMAAAWIAKARRQAVDRINSTAGRIRLRIYTDIPGQDALYLEKRAEAVAYVAEARAKGDPADLAAYPLLANETGVTAPTAWHLAQLWLNRSDQFKRVGAATERARMQALIAVGTAPDEATIETIENTFNEALNGLPL